MATPRWLAATAGQKPQPGQVNQFLGTHPSAWIYSGSVLQASQTTGSGAYDATASQYVAQSFTTGSMQTTVGQVWLQVSTVGGSPLTASIAPLTVSLYASSGGAPTGSALASTTLTEQYVYSSPFWLTVPLAAAGLSPSTVYQIVLSPVGNASAYYAWQQSNQVSGASLSSDGVTWTGQSNGLMYQVYDNTGTGSQPVYLVDGAGARVTVLTYNTGGQVASITESVVAQAGTSFYSTRTLTYTGGQLAGVA